MLDTSILSSHYEIRRLGDPDADSILELCEGNTQFYQYCEAKPSREQVLHDLHITPPGIESSGKYYIGFFQEGVLVAVMDLIDGYPEPDMAFIGFFMTRKELQGRQIGSMIIRETAVFLKTVGKTAIRLAIDKDNPQSTHFWTKNGFFVIREHIRNGWTLLEAEKAL
ncbi:MAG: GNAT family N-acetyltransferase [Oscillospiraceae bacterium]|nr:GNAT family N-acetyltransferase [Oscillospiraceae bacterium]